MAKLNSVNVVEIIGCLVQEIDAFSDDQEGNNEAEELFRKKALENGATAEDMQTYMDDGCYCNGDYDIFLVHSS